MAASPCRVDLFIAQRVEFGGKCCFQSNRAGGEDVEGFGIVERVRNPDKSLLGRGGGVVARRAMPVAVMLRGVLPGVLLGLLCGVRCDVPLGLNPF